MKSNKNRLTILQLLQSVFAALIGIQSEEKLKEAFEKITLGQIVFCAIILVGLFVGTVLSIVTVVLAVYT
ncbi:hypothetical protein A9Q81_17235 [Gammaproteobacteria bacterium 42_54_T18]|nr:hypothetical protein A9Q81_17235 [Gammaproteobacteria bacterium 42_54_T18]